MGGGLYNYLEGKSNRFLEFFTDSVHPNDRGYSVYADVAKAELIEYPIFSDIENKDHTVTISVSGKPPYITIASFIVTE